MIIIAAAQLIGAFKKNIDASNALKIANAAVEQARADANEISGLKHRIEQQSATIDLVAGQAMKAKELSQEIADRNIKAEEKLTEIDSALNKAKESLANLESYSQYYAVVISAMGEDRTAYDQLGEWAADNSFPFREQAQQVRQKIMDDHSRSIPESGFTVNWNEGVDPNKLTLEQLKQDFFSPNHNPYTRRALLEYIWQRNDIPKILRLDFMVDVMKNDKHLMVCEYAGRYFTQGTELQKKSLAKEYLIKWWADNRSKFEEKPDPNK
jgi:hypothetical protein